MAGNMIPGGEEEKKVGDHGLQIWEGILERQKEERVKGQVNGQVKAITEDGNQPTQAEVKKKVGDHGRQIWESIPRRKK